MTTAENLYDSTRNFLTPDSVQKFSMALDEPEEKVHAGLQSVVPTLLSGIINEGSTPKGAKKISLLMEGTKLDGIIPNNLNDEGYLSRGESLVEDLFGDKYHTIASSLTPETGLDPKNVEKLMEMAAPAVLGVVGSKLNDTRPATVNGYLKEQKNRSLNFSGKRRLPFALIAVIMVLVMFGVLQFFNKTIPVDKLEEDLSSLEKSVTQAPVAIEASDGLTVQELPGFLASAKVTELPKRFTLKTVRFKSGTTDMRGGGDQELNALVASLKRYPKSTASIEAYTEDTGDEDENLLYSENRAMLVREELIGRGIEPSRIRAEGRGIATDKNQVYFVITKIK